MWRLFQISTVKDPIEVVELMIQKYPTDQIMKLFKVCQSIWTFVVLDQF